MAKSPFTKRDEHRELTRRALIKWSVAAGAALGVSRGKIFEILERTAGKDTAQAAAANPTTRSVHIDAGNGALSWFTLLWPQVAIAAAATSTNAFAWHKPGLQTNVVGTTKPLTIGPDTPFAKLPASQQMTCFLAGNNETHTKTPKSPVNLGGNDIYAVSSALQSASPSVIPVVTVGTDVSLGAAPGAPAVSNVSSGSAIVGLFNSAASRAGGMLANTSDAQLYKAHYDAFTQLNRAANRSTQIAAYQTASGAAGFLGTNLSAQLAITPADLTRYGITASTRSTVTSIADVLIVAAKSFAMGLTNSVILPAMLDDPHGAFDSGDVNTIPAAIGAVLDAFMGDLQTLLDDNTQTPLAGDTVITITGDTMKDCTQKAGWPDGTANNSNTTFVLGAGYLNTGWFGSIDATNKATGFDVNGNAATYNGVQQATYSTASIAYAIAKGDTRAISTFANGISLPGIWVPQQT